MVSSSLVSTIFPLRTLRQAGAVAGLSQPSAPPDTISEQGEHSTWSVLSYSERATLREQLTDCRFPSYSLGGMGDLGWWRRGDKKKGKVIGDGGVRSWCVVW